MGSLLPSAYPSGSAKQYVLLPSEAATKAQEPIVIKANAQGLCVLINALVSAIAFTDGTAEIFDGKAELHEVVVKLLRD